MAAPLPHGMALMPPGYAPPPQQPQQMQQQQPLGMGLDPATALPTTDTIQAFLEDNDRLIGAVSQAYGSGRLDAAAAYQARLHANLTYLAAVADASTPSSAAMGTAAAGNPAPPRAAQARDQAQAVPQQQQQQQQQQRFHAPVPPQMQQQQQQQGQQFYQQQHGGGAPPPRQY